MYNKAVEDKLLKTKTTHEFLSMVIREKYDEGWSKELEEHYKNLPCEWDGNTPYDHFLTKEKRDELRRQKAHDQ